MKERKKNSEAYINKLEDKIVDLTLQLKSKTNELNSVRESNKKSIGKLIHNLKNPIGVIFSFSDMIIEDIEDYTTEKLKKHLHIIKKSASFSLQLLKTVAKYSQLQSPNLAYSFKSVNYTELVNGIANEFNTVSVKKNIHIERILSKNPILLTVDTAEFSIALKHIINNAFRYSNNNTTIKITVKENLNTVETIINDEGIGISEEYLSIIFNEFCVVNTYSEDKQKCIGLGLTIANKIIKDHKGTVSIKSILNKGTEIRITLPK
ncbi:MAG: hypothetical protein COC22_06690 [Flavobacteriaceae bacterium]|nr:MAG: hypothetical protein COC22_06690 [Flavobacteriaceae bacterium]